jgi:hypothetical protein
MDYTLPRGVTLGRLLARLRQYPDIVDWATCFRHYHSHRCAFPPARYRARLLAADMRDADIMSMMTRIDLPPGPAKLVAMRIADQ